MFKDKEKNEKKVISLEEERRDTIASERMGVFCYTFYAVVMLALFIPFTVIIVGELGRLIRAEIWHMLAFFVLGLIAMWVFFAIHLIKFYIPSVAVLIFALAGKLAIVEDRLYKTVPYEKIDRLASRRYYTCYKHGYYFEKYGKYTDSSTSCSIDFDCEHKYYLLIVNTKRPKILECYNKDTYELKED